MDNAWLMALKEWNSKRAKYVVPRKYSVPKKGTKQYAAVKRLQKKHEGM